MKIHLLSYLACLSHLGPITFGIFVWKRLNNARRLFLGFCLFLFTEHVVQIVYSINRWNNLEISHYGILIENLILAGVYIASGKGKIFQIVFLALVGLYLAGWGLIMAFFHVPYTIDSWALVLGMFVMICFGVAYMFQLLMQSNRTLQADPIFWVASGSLFYNIGAILIIGLANELAVLGYAKFHSTWQINILLIIASNLIFMKSFRCPSPQQIL